MLILTIGFITKTFTDCLQDNLMLDKSLSGHRICKCKLFRLHIRTPFQFPLLIFPPPLLYFRRMSLLPDPYRFPHVSLRCSLTLPRPPPPSLYHTHSHIHIRFFPLVC